MVDSIVVFCRFAARAGFSRRSSQSDGLHELIGDICASRAPLDQTRHTELALIARHHEQRQRHVIQRRMKDSGKMRQLLFIHRCREIDRLV